MRPVRTPLFVRIGFARVSARPDPSSVETHLGPQLAASGLLNLT